MILPAYLESTLALLQVPARMLVPSVDYIPKRSRGQGDLFKHMDEERIRPEAPCHPPDLGPRSLDRAGAQRRRYGLYGR